MTRSVEFWLRALERATDEELDAITEAYLADKADREARPLAYARLWHNEVPKTSQRRTAQRMLLETTTFGFVLGGNRSGKSEMGAQLDVAFALGSDHPDVAEWARANRLDVGAMPSGPGTWWSCALTSSDSRRYVRPKVAKYLPPDAKWRNREGQGEAEVTFNGGWSKIVFKDVSQGREAFQGDAPRGIRFDEEPKKAGVVKEAKMRLVDNRGRMFFTMTPLYGWTKLLEDHVREPDADTVVEWLHGTDNPHVPQDVLRKLLSKYSESERAARERGEIVAMEGRIYREWERRLHLVDSLPIPDDWPVFGAWDFGTRNPTAILAAALDPADDTLHLFDGRYESEKTLANHAAWVKSRPWFTRARWIVADSAARSERLTLAREHGIVTVKSPKGVRDGINAVAERLRPDVEGRPHLVVHRVPQLDAFVREVEGYVWDTTARQGDMADKPRKRADHFMDAVAYLCRRLALEEAAV